jgi:hypothetical protein
MALANHAEAGVEAELDDVTPSFNHLYRWA